MRVVDAVVELPIFVNAPIKFYKNRSRFCNPVFIIVIMEWRASQTAWLFPRHSPGGTTGRTPTCYMEATVEWLKRSASTVRSQDWRGRPLGRLQSSGRRLMEVRSARAWSWAGSALAIWPSSFSRPVLDTVLSVCCFKLEFLSLLFKYDVWLSDSYSFIRLRVHSVFDSLVV